MADQCCDVKKGETVDEVTEVVTQELCEQHHDDGERTRATRMGSESENGGAKSGAVSVRRKVRRRRRGDGTRRQCERWTRDTCSDLRTETALHAAGSSSAADAAGG